MPNPSIRTVLASGLLLLGCSQNTHLVMDSKLEDQFRRERWDTEGPSAEATVYKLVPQAFASPELRHVLERLNLPADKWQAVPCEGAPAEYGYRDGSRFAKYSVARSELLVTDTTVPALDSRETPDTSSVALRKRMIEELKRTDSSLASRFNLLNLERVNRLDSGEKRPRLAYVYGRHVRERDGRLVLGTSSQIRQGFGRGYRQKHFMYTNFEAAGHSKSAVPTRRGIYERLAKYAGKPEDLGLMEYPFASEPVPIESLIVRKIFKSYLHAPHRYPPDSIHAGAYLVPAITVYAEAKLKLRPRKEGEPEVIPPSVMLHYNFPCVPGAGLCWPGGKQGLGSELQAGIEPEPATQPSGADTAGTSPKTGATPTPARPAPTKP